ncbi:MAG: hypothetical protein IRZ08_10205 [Frankia sp.]|nr:hypothetical protein [Frankia sp.]
MVRVIAITLVCAALLLAAWVFVLAWRRLPIGRGTLAATAAVEVVVVALLVGLFVLLGRGERPAEALTFALYLIATLVALPIGAWWALGERSRSGTAVLGVAALAVAVMVERLDQTWGAGVGG